ncbi:hypothetical protein IWX64_000507 [Arthrobacter sp. CAN_A212]|uniref:HTTM domain-containing protein n=1 Tax=Arthrobacter sp. CAN_A212 TaxID=2787719 RepID=UPI0018CBE28C
MSTQTTTPAGTSGARGRRDYGDVLAAASTTAYGLIGLSVVRIAYGLVILVDLFIHLPVRDSLWGPGAWYTTAHMARDTALGFSPFMLSSEAWMSDLVFFALMGTAVLFVLGWRTRWVTPALLALVWVLHERNPYLTNGGDNLMRIILVYLVFAKLSAYFSLDARRDRKKAIQQANQQAVQPKTAPADAGAMVGVLIHNAALVACIGQLCVLYLASGLYKVQGSMWFEGTAVYYITRVAEYNPWPEITALLAYSPLVITVATYLAIITQVAFPFTLLNKHSRHLVFVLLAGMHLGIGFLMGLLVFSAFMIATDLLLFTDQEWRRGYARFRVFRTKLRTQLRSRHRAGRAPTPEPRPTVQTIPQLSFQGPKEG